LIGAYYYPWYGTGGRHWIEGYLGTPELGEYDSSNSEVLRQHVSWAADHGIDFFTAAWWGQGSYEDEVIHGPLLDVMAESDLQFAILYESPGLLGMENDKIAVDEPSKRERLIYDFDYLAQNALSHPNYLRINGRPVVFLYLTRVFTGDVAAVLDEIRSTVAARNGQEPFIIGDEVYWHGPSPSRLELYDGVTAYNMHTSVAGIADEFASKVASRYEIWQRAARDAGVAFIPDVIPGFDDTAVRPEAEHPVIPRSPELFAQQLTDSVELAEGPVRLVMITSWNEWHEYTSVEPAKEYGTTYLELVADIHRAAKGDQ
jgi:hypothetical protein